MTTTTTSTTTMTTTTTTTARWVSGCRHWWQYTRTRFKTEQTSLNVIWKKEHHGSEFQTLQHIMYAKPISSRSQCSVNHAVPVLLYTTLPDTFFQTIIMLHSHQNSKHTFNSCKNLQEKIRRIALSCGIKISPVGSFGLVTKHACDRWTDGQNYDSQDRASIAASCGGVTTSCEFQIMYMLQAMQLARTGIRESSGDDRWKTSASLSFHDSMAKIFTSSWRMAGNFTIICEPSFINCSISVTWTPWLRLYNVPTISQLVGV